MSIYDAIAQGGKVANIPQALASGIKLADMFRQNRIGNATEDDVIEAARLENEMNRMKMEDGGVPFQTGTSAAIFRSRKDPNVIRTGQFSTGGRVVIDGQEVSQEDWEPVDTIRGAAAQSYYEPNLNLKSNVENEQERFKARLGQVSSIVEDFSKRFMAQNKRPPSQQEIIKYIPEAEVLTYYGGNMEAPAEKITIGYAQDGSPINVDASMNQEDIQAIKNDLPVNEGPLRSDLEEKAEEVKTQERTKNVEDLNAKNYTEIQKAEQDAISMVGLLDNFNLLYKDAIKGSGADFWASAAGLAKAAGIDANIEGLNNKQAADAIAAQLTMKIKSLAAGTSFNNNFSNTDLSFLKDMTPQTYMNEQGVEKLSQIMRKAAQRNQEIGVLASEYAAKNNGMIDEGFNKIRREYVNKNPIFSSNQKTVSIDTIRAFAYKNKMSEDEAIKKAKDDGWEIK